MAVTVRYLPTRKNPSPTHGDDVAQWNLSVRENQLEGTGSYLDEEGGTKNEQFHA